MPRRLAELRASEIPEVLTRRSVLVQPVGAIEQHGPHLPLGTDLIVATEACDAVVTDRGDELDLWLLPPLAVSKSNEHAWAAGTLWLSAQTMLAVLMDLGRSIATLPTRRLAFVNGHGGNSGLLGVACRELRLAHRLETFLLHPSLPPDHGGAGRADEKGMGIHGGIAETSLMLHLRPDLVDQAAGERNIPDALAENRYVRFGGSVSFGWLSDDFGPSGVIGDPTGASAELGKQQFEAMVRELGDALAEVAAFEYPASPRP